MSKKFKYFVKYRTNSGETKTKILLLDDINRAKLFEIREADPEACEILKCKLYDQGSQELDKEETIW